MPHSDSAPSTLHSHSSFIQDRAGRMGGETPELALEQVPQDASTKKLSECLKRIGDELDSNMELQRCGPWAPGIQPLVPFSLTSPEPRLSGPSSPGPGVQIHSRLLPQTQASRAPPLYPAPWLRSPPFL